MKNAITGLGLVVLCMGSAHAQLSSELTTTQFEQLLNEGSIANHWNDIQNLKGKKEPRMEDQQAVYAGYLEALRTIDTDNAELQQIIRKEMEATEQTITHVNTTK